MRPPASTSVAPEMKRSRRSGLSSALVASRSKRALREFFFFFFFFFFLLGGGGGGEEERGGKREEREKRKEKKGERLKIAGGGRGGSLSLACDLRLPRFDSLLLFSLSSSPYLRHRLLERVGLGAALLGDLLARSEGHFGKKLFLGERFDLRGESKREREKRERMEVSGGVNRKRGKRE